MTTDRKRPRPEDSVRSADHLNATEVLAVAEADTSLSSWEWVAQHALSCEACGAEVERMRRALEVNYGNPPNPMVFLLEGRSYALFGVAGPRGMFAIRDLKITRVFASKARQTVADAMIGVVRMVDCVIPIVAGELEDLRISLRDKSGDDAVLRLAAAPPEGESGREGPSSLWPALRRDREPFIEFFGDEFDNAYLLVRAEHEGGES
jgi:hypothetical protein